MIFNWLWKHFLEGADDAPFSGDFHSRYPLERCLYWWDSGLEHNCSFSTRCILNACHVPAPCPMREIQQHRRAHPPGKWWVVIKQRERMENPQAQKWVGVEVLLRWDSLRRNKEVTFRDLSMKIWRSVPGRWDSRAKGAEERELGELEHGKGEGFLGEISSGPQKEREF